MLIGDVRPTTLEGVKSLAAQLRKERGIKHSDALNIAAKAANCTNYRNALRVLPKRRSGGMKPYVLLTRYWYDKDQRHRIGRETLRIELSQPILDVCSKSGLKYVRGFGDLRMVAREHFVCDTIDPNQRFARDRLCSAERSLRFMERTGLRPLREYRKAYPDILVTDKLPGTDHSTSWVEPATNQFILVDEPYGGAPDEEERAAWAARNSWLIVKTSWPGMYTPYDCDLHVATTNHTSYDLGALVDKINAMPAPLLAEQWAGESAPSWETFLSPMATTPQDIRRARCRGTIYPTDSATTVPYSYSLGSSRRRPKGEMGFKGHIMAGRMIKAVLSSKHRPYAAYRRMNSVRSTLEDWMFLEIGRRELEGPKVLDVYYSDLDGDDPFWEMAATPAGLVTLLGNLKTILKAAYPDCAPLRQQLKRIDTSVALIGRFELAKT